MSDPDKKGVFAPGTRLEWSGHAWEVVKQGLTPDELTIHLLRKQLKRLEDKAITDQNRRILQKQAEDLREKIRGFKEEPIA